MTHRDDSSFSIAIVGSGGAGVMTVGNLLLKAVTDAGLYALMTRSFGPQIRGGEAGALLRFSSRPVECAGDSYDILIGVDWKNAERFAGEIPLRPDSLIIGDPGAGPVPEVFLETGARQIEIPLKDLAKKVPGSQPNMVALGALASLMKLPSDSLTDVLNTSFRKKGEALLKASHEASSLGKAFAEGLDIPLSIPQPQGGTEKRWSISGNQAAGLGAIRGGVRFAAAYPITPATEVLEWLAPALPKVGGSLVQAEDELASINMIIGASFGGTPSVTATSGPGLSLMSEAMGLAIASETPIVVIDVQRGGPSTGIPTKSEQSDLNIALYGMHGDAPHIVVAPTSITDCVFTTQWAVYLAESLQTAAIVLSDQAMGQARAVTDRPAELAFLGQRQRVEQIAEGEVYQRYALTASGVSPAAIPGTPGGQHTADGLEHTETGTPSAGAADHARQMDKRLNKLTRFDYGEHWAVIEGDRDAEFAVMTWGSLTGPVREAIGRARDEGLKVRLIAPRLLFPVQQARMDEALAGVSHLLVVEQTHSGQFTRYLKAEYDLPCRAESFHRPGPITIRPGEVHEHLINWSQSHA
jgi:2-oxoglutarate/2-oxoacid ferredoxin oxidoreductase subunit alpha